MQGINPQQIRAIQAMFAQQAGQEDGLVSFRAGRLFQDETTKLVTADKKRGKVKCVKDQQGIFNFQWFNRISHEKELELSIFPGAASWEKVPECKDGRVFLLRMTGSNRKHFFWMQEPEDEKDEEYSTNINKLCQGKSLGDEKSNDAANPSAANPFGAAPSGGAGGADPLTQMILNAMQQQQQGGGGGGAQAQNQLQQMAAMMQGQQQQQQQAALEEMKREPDLEDVLDPTANPEIVALLDDEKVVEQLAEHLPEGMQTREAMLEQLQSPQFQGALRQLQRAVNGPQMPILLQQMGVNPQNPNAVGTTAFLNSIGASNPPADDAESNPTDDDGDSEMSSDKKDGDKK